MVSLCLQEMSRFMFVFVVERFTANVHEFSFITVKREV